MSDWQTYKNEDWGFEVKHPKNWVEGFTRDNLKGGATVGVSFVNPQQVSGIRNGVAFVENRVGGPQSVEFFVQKGINPKSLSILEWSSDQAKIFKKNPPVFTPTTFAGHPAVLCKYPGNYGEKTFIQLNKTDIISVSVAQKSEDVVRDEIYQAILSTVKFTKGTAQKL